MISVPINVESTRPADLPQPFPDAAHRPSSRDLPSLDGLRAMSILFVILGHASQSFGNPHIKTLLSRLSQFGVCVFFVISGYLITTLLHREAEKRGRVSLPRFYLRRTLRIFPPYYAYLALVALGVGIGLWSIPADGRWWPAFAYVTNLFPTRFWLLSHSWSLAIEEQFYLTWPIVLATCVRLRGTTRGSQLSYRIACAALLAMPVLRVVVYEMTRDGIFTENVIFDYVAAGSALALFQYSGAWDRGRSLLASALRSGLTPLAAALALTLHVFFASGMRWTFALDLVLIIPVEAMLLALFVAWSVHNKHHPIGRILNLRVLRIVGIGSYSLYLWQQMFLGTESPMPESMPILVRILAAAACASLSYWLVERPSLRLRSRLERRIFPTEKGF